VIQQHIPWLKSSIADHRAACKNHGQLLQAAQRCFQQHSCCDASRWACAIVMFEKDTSNHDKKSRSCWQLAVCDQCASQEQAWW
jgi:hypothetical protein